MTLLFETLLPYWADIYDERYFTVIDRQSLTVRPYYTAVSYSQFMDSWPKMISPTS